MQTSRIKYIPIPILLLFFGRLLAMSSNSSPTMDEVLHTFHGVAYWRVPPAEMLPNITNNPPLANALIGLLTNWIVAPSLTLPDWVAGSIDALPVSQVFMWEVNPNGLQIIWVARYVIILLMLVLGAVAYRWAHLLTAQRTVALLALGLLTLDPNLLAHGALATAEGVMTLTWLLAGFVLWQYIRSDGKAAGVISLGIAIGLAFAAKFTGLFFVPIVGLAFLWRLWQTPSRWLVEVRDGVLVMLIAVVVMVAAYRADVAFLYQDFVWQQAHQLQGHVSFLLGEVSTQGWWYYFPVVSLVKTPLATILLLGIAVVQFVRVGLWTDGKLSISADLILPLLILTIIGAALITRVNIGYRYLLPALPALYIFIAVNTQHVTTRWRLGLLMAAVAASFWAHPNYLGYFNLLGGGPGNGWHIAVDSNIEWGQDIGKLVPYMAENNIDHFYGIWLGITPPEVYGLNITPMYPDDAGRFESDGPYPYLPEQPLPGTYVVGVSHWQGVFEDGSGSLDWLRENHEPIDKVGDSYLIFEVPPDPAPADVVLSGVTLGQLSAETLRSFGSHDLRPRFFDGRESLVFPADITTNSRWAVIGAGHLADDLLSAIDPTFVANRTATTHAALDYYVIGDFSVDWANIAADAAFDTASYVTNEATVTSEKWQEQAQPIEQPTFADSLTFIGYSTIVAEKQMVLRSWWRVEEQTPPDNLNAFVHLVDSAGNIAAQADSWGVQSGTLHAGDLILQQHVLPLAGLNESIYGLQVGLYEQASQQRLRVTTMGNAAYDRVLLTPVTVR